MTDPAIDVAGATQAISEAAHTMLGLRRVCDAFDAVAALGTLDRLASERTACAAGAQGKLDALVAAQDEAVASHATQLAEVQAAIAAAQGTLAAVQQDAGAARAELASSRAAISAASAELDAVRQALADLRAKIAS